MNSLKEFHREFGVIFNQIKFNFLFFPRAVVHLPFFSDPNKSEMFCYPRESDSPAVKHGQEEVNFERRTRAGGGGGVVGLMTMSDNSELSENLKRTFSGH